jgi:hypothetical protein
MFSARTTTRSGFRHGVTEAAAEADGLLQRLGRQVLGRVLACPSGRGAS